MSIDDEPPLNVLRRQLEDCLSSSQRKRCSFSRKLNNLKFLKLLFVVCSIGSVAAIGSGAIDAQWQRVLSLIAVISTMCSTFSNDLIESFGYAERLRQNVKTVSRIKSLKGELTLDVAIKKEQGLTFSKDDYWNYHKKLTDLLNDQNNQWQEKFSSNSK